LKDIAAEFKGDKFTPEESRISSVRARTRWKFGSLMAFVLADCVCPRQSESRVRFAARI